MLRHNLLLIYRSFKKDKSTFLINLTGLSTGLACVLLIFLWVNDELSMDKFHEKDKHLYQVMANAHNTDGIETWNVTPGLLAEALIEEIPGIKYAVSGTDPSWFGQFFGQFTLNIEDKHFKAEGQFAGKDFFNVFSYNLIEGDKDAVLGDKSAIVISEELSMRLFGTAKNVMGRMIEWEMGEMKAQFMVSGIFKDIPAHSSTQFDFVLPFDYFQEELVSYPNWDNNYAITYLVLDDEVDIGQLNGKLADFIKTKDEGSNIELFLTRYSEYYLHNKYQNGVAAGGRIEYVQLFSVIAFFILIIACINFMNLFTAKATKRIKEVGIKKAIGAHRLNLVFQYLGESLLIAFLSMLVAIVMVKLFLPQFNIITGKQLDLYFTAYHIVILLAVVLITGFLAGSYPALYLSGYRPSLVLKGKFSSVGGELWARKGLVVFQFALSVVLIVSVMVIYNQIEYVRHKNLGFNKDNIIFFDQEGRVAESVDTFIDEIKKLPGIVNAAAANFSLGRLGVTYGVSWEGKNPDDLITFNEINVGYDALEVLGIELKEGRAFSKDFATDSTAVIFNETAIKVMGLENPIGEQIDHYSGSKHIVGVSKDFHMESLYHEVKPLIVLFDPDNTNAVMAKIESGMEQTVIAGMEEFYQSYNTGFEFNYQFLDQDYQNLYVAEQRVSILSRYFAGLAILISCLGLFGLAAFTAERRTKEIGIRKVMGASEWKIIQLLSGDFARMVLVAIVVALPLSYYLTKNWLDGFAYKIDLEWWYFIGAGILTMLIALLTVSFQSIKAALMNPVESLRSE